MKIKTRKAMTTTKEKISMKNTVAQKDTNKQKKVAPVTFVFTADPNAKQAFIAGDFNNWDPAADRMTKRKGAFVKKLELPTGAHQYKFVVDGEWRIDPSAPMQKPDEAGILNSVVQV